MDDHQLRVYLAAPWVCRPKARNVRDILMAAGFTVVSRWLDADETLTTQTEEALNDLDDLDGADVLVVLNLEKSEGKAFEQGYAFAKGIPIIVVGTERLNVFQHLRSIPVVPTVQDAINLLNRTSSVTFV